MKSANLKILLICLVSLLPTRLLFAQERALPDTLKSATADSVAVATLDSIAVAGADSLAAAGIDSLALAGRDSIAVAGMDSLAVAGADSLAMADSLAAPKVVLTEKQKRKMYRDSVKAVKDSIRLSTPRILETCAFPDSLYYEKIFAWNTNTYFNKQERIQVDTTFNDWYTEYPFFHEDVNATYLGVIGSASQNFNWFKRREFDIAPFYAPYLTYTYTPETMPFYNTKTPHTVLAYWGTLFSYTNKEESSMKFMNTQNITPKLNLHLEYHMYGGKGLLTNEGTNNRTFSLTGNYLGERYVANGGFISNTIRRDENGGIQNPKEVLDTILDAKTIAVNLQDASNRIVKRSFFINHSYGLPIRFKKDMDSLGRDSLAAGEGTMAYIGHYGEYSRFSKFYADKIGQNDRIGRAFYNDNFYIDPTTSADSMRVADLTNRLFIRLQPWDSDAIISHIEGGVGYQMLTYYSFRPESFLYANSNVHLNNSYIYASANGKFRKYFAWEGFGRFNFLGYNRGDFDINAKATFSFYPFKDRSEGIDLTARFSSTLKKPDYYSDHLYSNHFIWDHEFGKVSKTKIEGELSIPKWKMSAYFGYALVNNNIYYDTLGIIRQTPELVNVMSAYLQKDFKLWKFHFDNQILFQMSSNQESIPLPMLALHLRYYFQFDLVKNVMKVQVGADGTFTTSYYAPAYNPATGQFHNQVSEKIGNTPYIDVFANFQWKTASIFLKFTNANQGWPTADYFSAYHYIKPKRAFKVGIFWPFFVK